MGTLWEGGEEGGEGGGTCALGADCLRKIAAHQITASVLYTFTITVLINTRMKFVMTTT